MNRIRPRNTVVIAQQTYDYAGKVEFKSHPKPLRLWQKDGYMRIFSWIGGLKKAEPEDGMDTPFVKVGNEPQETERH